MHNARLTCVAWRHGGTESSDKKPSQNGGVFLMPVHTFELMADSSFVRVTFHLGLSHHSKKIILRASLRESPETFSTVKDGWLIIRCLHKAQLTSWLGHQFSRKARCTKREPYQLLVNTHYCLLALMKLAIKTSDFGLRSLAFVHSVQMRTRSQQSTTISQNNAAFNKHVEHSFRHSRMFESTSAESLVLFEYNFPDMCAFSDVSREHL